MLESFFDHCQYSPNKNLELIEQMVREAELSGAPSATGLYEEIIFRASLILGFLYDVPAKSALDLFSTQVLSFFTTPVLEQVVAKKALASEEDLQDIAEQMLYVAATFGVEPDLVPYSPAEINDFITNANSEVEVIPPLLANTIGHAMMVDMPEYTVIMRLLPTEPQTTLSELFAWEDAFILGINLHLAWSFFPTASERDRIFILQHYLYRAIVLGVPVQTWLRQTFSEPIAGPVATQYVQALLGSFELVPMNTNANLQKKLSEVTRDFISTVVREAIPTLAQEKFLKNWYDTSSKGEVYRAWLRSTLGIVYKLQTNTIHRG